MMFLMSLFVSKIKKMEDDDRPSTLCQKITMVAIALSNNISYFIILASAQRIVDRYKENGLLPSVDLALCFSGLFAGSINTALTQHNVSYDTRFIANTILMFVGYLGCAFSPQFWMCLISVMLLGSSCNFGESVIIGYMAYVKKSSMMKYFGIGTGLSGILGALLTIVFISMDFNYSYSFLCFLPFAFIFFVSYFFVLREKPSELDTKPLISNATENISENEENVKCFSTSFLSKVAYYFITYDIIYFSGDVVVTTYLDCAQTPDYQKTHKYIYPLLWLVYNCGLLIFCSTLSFFEFHHLRYLMFFQMMNFFVWLLQALYHWMPIWAEFVLIFVCGSVSGLTYANTFHALLSDNRLTPKEKELGSNVTTLSATVAILLDTCFGMLAEKTFLRDSVPK